MSIKESEISRMRNQKAVASKYKSFIPGEIQVSATSRTRSCEIPPGRRMRNRNKLGFAERDEIKTRGGMD